MCALQLDHQAPSHRLARTQQKGTALVLSLITVMIIASLGAGLVQLHTAIDKRHEFAIDRRRALYLAEAGLAEASFAVSQGRSGVIASDAVPAGFGRGVYWVEADDLPGDRLALRCTAQVGTAEFVVRTMIVPNVNPITTLGFFGSDGVNIGFGSVIDGYHSGSGDYLSQVNAALPVLSTGDMGLLGSDSDIVLNETSPTDEEFLGLDTTVTALAGAKLSGTTTTSAGAWAILAGSTSGGSSVGTGTGTGSTSLVGTGPSLTAFAGVVETTVPTLPTHVYGRLRPGARSLVRSGGLSVITGDVDPFEAPPTLPEVSLPTPTEYLTGSVDITADQTGIGVNVETWVQNDITVTDGATLTFEGPSVIRCETIQLLASSSIEFDDSAGPIHIYATEGFNFRPGSTVKSISSEDVARGTYIFVPGSASESDRITLRSSGKFHGALYAPDDIVRIPQNLHWIGSAVGRVLFTAPGAHLTHDRRMAVGGNGTPALPEQASWQVVPLGKEVARQLPIDPILALALRGVTPVPSAQGAIETDVEISYIDSTGQSSTYMGPLATFPIASAQRVIGARWTDPRDGTVRDWATPAGVESTTALIQERERIRALKAIILGNNATTDVATLEDNVVAVEVSAIMAGVDVSAEPVEVQRAVQRVDDADVTLLPDPVETANRATALADEYAAKAQIIQTAAEALLILGADPVAADPLIIALRAAVNDCGQAALDAQARSNTTNTTTGGVQETAAQEAAAFAEAAMKLCYDADNLFAQLQAL